MISAVILTHNSQHSIKATISSVKWCDEVLVIDDDSTDKTAEFARSVGARVLSHPLRDDFAGQRNYALNQAVGPWVLFLDSDETVTPQLRDEIVSRYGKEAGIEGYILKRQDVLFGTRLRFGEAGNIQLVRLAKKDGGSWKLPVHEVWEVIGRLGYMKEPLLHSSHANVAQFLDKINYYSTLRARYLYKQMIRVYWWQIVTYPTGKFLRNYVYLQGFRDGTIGMVHALMMSFHSFLTRAKLWHLWDSQSQAR